MLDPRLESVLTKDIYPDPNQPRKIFEESHIKGLAKSLAQEGLINPIEVDEKGMIITGECRWRAANQLKWEKVYVKVNRTPYSEYYRLRHQMAENVHQSGTNEDSRMNPIDTAKGYARLFELKTNTPYKPGLHGIKHDEMGRIIKGPFELIAEEIGVNKQNVWEYLKILEQPGFVIKDIEAGRPRTYYREAEGAPKEKQKKIIKEKIAKGHYKSRREIRDDIAIARKFPDLADVEIARQKSKESLGVNRVLSGIARLGLALEALPFDQVDIREKGIVKKQLQWLLGKINEYL